MTVCSPTLQLGGKCQAGGTSYCRKTSLKRILHNTEVFSTYLYNCNSFSGPSNRAGGRNGKLSLKPVQKTTASMRSSTVPSSNTTPVAVKAFRLGLSVTLPCRIWPGRSSLTKAFLSKNLVVTVNRTESVKHFLFGQRLYLKGRLCCISLSVQLLKELGSSLRFFLYNAWLYWYWERQGWKY